MVTLYTFGPRCGLPDPSPFVVKGMLLLKLAGVEYQANTKGMMKAPKGKLPYIDDAGELVADSTFIRKHLEKKYGIDFDAGYSAQERALAWSVEKMLEGHLYFALAHSRWMIDANFLRGPVHYFESIPAFVRPLVRWMVRGQIRKQLHGQGMGRHKQAEIDALAKGDLDALSALLGDKQWLLGERPCGADATMIAFIDGVLCPEFDSAMRTHAESLPNLVAYRNRAMARFFPA